MDRPEERLALIELFERDGRIGRAIDVWHWPVTLGRALDNHVVLDDPHVAPHHAWVGPDGNGRLVLTPLRSLNGVLLGGKRVAAAETLPANAAGGTLLQLGATKLRLRVAGEALAPEQPMPGGTAGHPALPLVYGLLLMGFLLSSHWVSLDPGADYSSWLSAVIGLPLALAGWCGIWALMSKLFQHRFDFSGHLRIALPWLVGISAVDLLWPQAMAAIGAPRLWMLSQPLQAVMAALLIRAHLAHVLPLHPRAVTATVAAVALASGAISMARTWRATDSFSNEAYMSTLPLPALRLSGSVPSATLVQDMAPLAAKLAQRVKKSRDDDDDGDGASDTNNDE